MFPKLFPLIRITTALALALGVLGITTGVARADPCPLGQKKVVTATDAPPGTTVDVFIDNVLYSIPIGQDGRGSVVLPGPGFNNWFAPSYNFIIGFDCIGDSSDATGPTVPVGTDKGGVKLGDGTKFNNEFGYVPVQRGGTTGTGLSQVELGDGTKFQNELGYVPVQDGGVQPPPPPGSQPEQIEIAGAGG